MPMQARSGNANVYYWNKSFLHYSYALVMRKVDNVHPVQVQIVSFLKRAGLRVAFLTEDEDHPGVVVMLITAEPYKQVVRRFARKKARRASMAAGVDVAPETHLGPDGMPDPASMSLLQKENMKLYSERYLRFGATSGSRLPHDYDSMTTAKKLSLTQRIIVDAIDRINIENHGSSDYNHSKRALIRTNTKGDVLSKSSKLSAWDLVDKMFPLHDEQWNIRFVRLYMKSLFQWQRWVPPGLRKRFHAKSLIQDVEEEVVEALEESDPEEQSKEVANALVTRDAMELFGGVEEDWAVEALREHMGERTGFYFAFMQHYTGWLGPMAVGMAITHLALRWVSWGWYLRVLSVLGLCVPAIWGPFMLKYWQRRSNELKLKWQLSSRHEAENPNLKAHYVDKVKNKETAERHRVYDPNNNRSKVKWGLPFLVALNLLFMIITITPFAQLYTYGRMAPLCSCCEWHMQVGTQNSNATVIPALPVECEIYAPAILTQEPPTACTNFLRCFNTPKNQGLRGVFLGLQGFFLGVWLDMVQFELMKSFTSWLTDREHWATEAKYNSKLIQKQFVFCWVNMYFFFLALAFVYVPYGRRVQQALVTAGLGWFVPEYGWVTGIINLDEAILSPLVFSQMTNLVAETILPYVRMKVTAKKKLPTVMSFKATAMPGGIMKTLRDSPVLQNMAAGFSPGSTARSRATPAGKGAKINSFGKAERVAAISASSTAVVPSPNSSNRLIPVTSMTVDEMEASLYDAMTDAPRYDFEKARREARAARLESERAASAAPSLADLEAAFEAAMGGDDDGATSSGSDVTASSSDDDKDLMAERSLERERRRSSASRSVISAVKSVTSGSRRSPDYAAPRVVKVKPAKKQKKNKKQQQPQSFHVKVMSMGMMTEESKDDTGSSDSLQLDDIAKTKVQEDSDDSSSSSDGEVARAPDSITVQLAVRVKSELKKAVKVMRHTRDFNRVDAAMVLHQAGMKEFHPKDDFLDMVKQYGLVLMFTVVWAYAPMAAFLNNLLEVRFDAFKILVEKRRAVPREDAGIGGWLHVFMSQNVFSLPVVAGLAVLATGGLEWWMFDSCHVGWAADDDRMVPDWNCFNTWGVRLLAAVVIERCGTVMLRQIVKLSPLHAATKKALQERDEKRREHLRSHLIPSLSEQFTRDLKFLFAAFDANGNGVLNRSELSKMLELLVGAKLPPADHNLLIHQFDTNESNTITCAEFGVAVRLIKEDSIMQDLFVMDDLQASVHKLVALIRSGTLAVADCMDFDPARWKRFKPHARALIHADTPKRKRRKQFLRKRLGVDFSSRRLLGSNPSANSLVSAGSSRNTVSSVPEERV